MDKYLTLVNFKNKYSEEMKEGFNFINVDVNKDMNANQEFIEEETYKAFIKLQERLLKKGVSITLNSAGRTVEEQQKYFDEMVDVYGKEKAMAMVALPGDSEHHLGLAIDVRIRPKNMLVKIINKLTRKDIKKIVHCELAEFGFVLRYPKGTEKITGVKLYEPWHFRYVGIEHAQEMQKNGLTLEEYIEYRNNQKQGLAQ